jgi:RNA ligase
MKLNREEILKLVEDGYLLMNKHPEKELWILNYSKNTAFEKYWNEITLMCRGIVVDAEFNIVARPFGKFFNLEEHEPSEIPTNLGFEAFEKMDGSLGISFNYEGEWIFASRGSFTSDQAVKGMEIINDSVENIHGVATFDKDYTYVFEIIYPENRIVIDYGSDEKLVMLGVINTETGEEMSYDDMFKNYALFFEVVKKHDVTSDISKLKDLEEDNKEGFVVRYSNGFRVKVKFDEYCRLHRIVTNVSNKTIWESLKNDEGLDEVIDRVPDEFYNWVKRTEKGLNNSYTSIEVEALREYVKIGHFLSNTVLFVDSVEHKKQFALKAKEHKLSGLLFSMYNDKSYSLAIWKMIKPEWSTPFRDGFDS